MKGVGGDERRAMARMARADARRSPSTLAAPRARAPRRVMRSLKVLDTDNWFDIFSPVDNKKKVSTFVIDCAKPVRAMADKALELREKTTCVRGDDTRSRD